MSDTPTHEALRQCRDALRDANKRTRHPAYDWPDCLQSELSAALAAADAALSVPVAPRWHWHDLQAGAHLPPCDAQRIFVGVNVNGYTCTFNATDGDKCWNETPEESIEQMSGLRWWAPYVSPMDVAESIAPAALSVQAEPRATMTTRELADRVKSGEPWELATTQPPAPVPAVPLTEAAIEKLREATFSTGNPFCPVDSKSMRKAVRAAERAHGITGATDHG